MEGFQKTLNDMFLTIYHNILRLEEKALEQAGNLNLSIREMHLIERVGKRVGLSIRELAEELKIKSPSVTVAVQKLEKKGYLKKVPCANDGRAVRIFLTQAGRRANAYHQYCHRMMVKAMSEEMQDAEKSALLSAVEKLNVYFLKSLGEGAV